MSIEPRIGKQGGVQVHDETPLRDPHRLAELGFQFLVGQVRSSDLMVTAVASRHIGFIRVPADLWMQRRCKQAQEANSRDFKELPELAGMDSGAENAEHESDRLELLVHNIDYGQGFLVGEPHPTREA